MKKMLLFDIDGTLLLTGGCGIIAFEKAFHDCFGISDAWNNLQPDGKTDPAIVREILSWTLKRELAPEEIETLTHSYLKYFEEEVEKAPNFRLMPGVSDLIPKLAASGQFAMGLATGNFEEAGWLKLKRGNLNSHFHFGGFGSDSENRRELTQKAHRRGNEYAGKTFAPGDVFVIGDTPYDIDAAKASGFKTIALPTGSYSQEDLKTHEPTHLMDSLESEEEFLRLVD